MNSVCRRTLACLALGGAAALVGCGRGDGIQRVDLSGAATYRGQPIESGSITFDPQGGGPVAVAQIAGGVYKATGPGAVPVGKYIVRISSTVEDRENWVEGAMPEPPQRELLPARYNRQSDLTMEVPSNAKQMEKDFNLD